MKFDDFDKEMRIYEESLDQYIQQEMYLVARLDGRSFTRLTKEVCGFEAPFDIRFRDLMTDTVKALMNAGFRIIYGYTESDEISLLFHPQDNSFGRKVRKINTTLAGEASAAFSLALGKVATFDCRVIPLPDKSRVADYFAWRQEDSHRNSLNAHCYWGLRKKGISQTVATAELEGRSISDKKELLSQMGVNYDELPAWQKTGMGIYFGDVLKEGYNPITNTKVITKRRELIVNYDLLTGEDYRKFVLDFLND